MTTASSTINTPKTRPTPVAHGSRRELFSSISHLNSPILTNLLTNSSEKKNASSPIIDCYYKPFRELGRRQKWSRINEKLRPELNKINEWLKRDFGIKLSEVNFVDNVSDKEKEDPLSEQIEKRKIDFEINYKPFEPSASRKYKITAFEALKVHFLVF
jgi:hypothetical protein